MNDNNGIHTILYMYVFYMHTTTTTTPNNNEFVENLLNA